MTPAPFIATLRSVSALSGGVTAVHELVIVFVCAPVVAWSVARGTARKATSNHHYSHAARFVAVEVTRG